MSASTSVVAAAEERLVYSVGEAAALLSVSRRTLYSLILDGEFPSVKLGARRLVTRRALEAWVANLEAAKAPER